MLSLESARQQILSRIAAQPGEHVALTDANGRYLAEPISAPIDLPPFDNSAMDGYAVRANETAAASRDRPMAFRVVGRSSAGDAQPGSIAAGECARVFTGAPIPAGADAVVMQEDTNADPTEPSQVWIHEEAKPWENIRFAGEDVKRGAPALPAGSRLTAARIGLAAALGMTSVAVGPRPRIAIVATGNELVEPGQPLGPGRIYESNRTMLAQLLVSAGAVATIFPLVLDTLEQTKTALTSAFAAADIVLSSGGVSVGESDFVKPAFEAIGGRLELWRVSMKPGKPFAFGELGQKLLFGLPGNPVSAFVTFLLLVRPAILRWQGAMQVEPGRRNVLAAEVFENRGDRRHFVRACLDDAGRARIAGTQASHLFSSLAAAQGLVDLAPSTRVAPGEVLQFLDCEN